MREATWPEITLAGTLFAILTNDEALFKFCPAEFESIAIDHGVLRLGMKDGQQFELTVRQLK